MARQALVFLAVAVFAFCVFLPAVSVSASELPQTESPHRDEMFIGVDEIQPGAVGVGRTVFSGTTIEEFGVEVLGVLEQGDASHPYIMVRVFGEAVERAGGIVDGMSGSPVYIGGRLAGAVSHVYSGTDRATGLVTPIEPMLRLLSLARGQGDACNGAPVDASPVRSPLLVSGISGRSLELACSALRGHSYVAVAAGVAGDVEDDAAIVPGSAVSVQLADGDIEVASIGTITYVESDAFVAFGHHFEAAGTVDYIASAAEIVCIVQSENGPFKVAATLKPIGRVTQDRFTGLAGTLRTAAETVEVTIDVLDTETGDERTYEFHVIRDQRFVYSLITAGVLQALDSTMGRIGEGTSTVSMSMELSTGLTVTRTNTYSDRYDIAMWSLNEIGEAVSLVAFNESRPVELLAVNVDVEVSPDIRTARIEAVEVDKDQAQPGDSLKARIVLRPYRSPVVIKEVDIAVPEDANPGYAQLSVRGGSEVFGAYVDESVSQSPADDVETGLHASSTAAYPDLDSQLAEFVARPKSTELVVDLHLPGPVSAEDTQGENADPGQLESPEPLPVPVGNEDEWLRENDQDDRLVSPGFQLSHAGGEDFRPVRVVVPLEWVVYGYEDLGIEIVAPESESLEIGQESQ